MRYLMITALVVAISICNLNATDSKSKVAMVDLDQVKNLLLDRAFKRSGNADLKKKHEEIEKKQQEAQKKIQAATMSGKSFNPMDFAKDMMPTNMNERKKINTLIDEELIIVVNELFPKEYILIFKKSYGNNVLYTSIVISDITQNIKQYLILQKTKRNNTELRQ